MTSSIIFCSSFYDAFSVTKTGGEWKDDKWRNWKGFWRKRWWPILSYYPEIRMEGMRKTTKNLSQDSRFRGRDLNPGPQEYEAGALTITFGHVPMRTERTWPIIWKDSTINYFKVNFVANVVVYMDIGNTETGIWVARKNKIFICHVYNIRVI
jgi:hypothetical protein